ncbi:hypothetical protein [Actinokineospora sp.]|uniref:hypothetical protein n=1 Tax=Actinokineospora sp. TaxID=1872133 RepID=UPI004037E42F
MSNNEATNTEYALVDELAELIRATANVICDEQPDVPQPADLGDLDSFSTVQVVLELENVLEVKLLEALGEFRGDTFRDLAGFIVDTSVEADEIDGFTARVRRVAYASGSTTKTPVTAQNNGSA